MDPLFLWRSRLLAFICSVPLPDHILSGDGFRWYWPDG
jgi:hypothetical protein